MNPIGLLILLFCISLVLSGSRQRALFGFCAAILYLPFDQHLVVAGTNLFALRFVELAVFIRILAKKELRISEINRFDKLFMLLYTYTTLIFLLRSSEDLTYRIGILVDAFLCYFSFRALIQEPSDIISFLKTFIILLIPFAFCVSIETLTTRNPFEFLGKFDPGGYVRNGRQRAFGSFQHPSLVGTVGAAFLPLYFAIGYRQVLRKYAIVGIVLCLLIVWASNSGAPISCLLFATVGWLFWKLRTHMKSTRRLVAACLVALALFMKSPIWYLPAHLSDITGGDGYHRSYLIDVAFHNIAKWGLAGMSLQETADWFPTQLAWGVADMTNQYISFGITAGIAAMLLFIALFVRGFSVIGRAITSVRSAIGSPSEAEFLLWGLGVVLLVHAGNLFGISYYDQSFAIFYFHLAMISSISAYYSNPVNPVAFSAIPGVQESEHIVPTDVEDPNAPL